VHDVLDKAADLRSKIRRLRRGSLAAELKMRVSYFDRASKEKGFWTDKGLADEQAYRANKARDLMHGFLDLERQAEATEDLAFEAFYNRSTADARTLQAEIELLAGKLQPLAERLYAALYPPRMTPVLYVTAGRGAWKHLLQLTDSYRAWCTRNTLTVRSFILVNKTDDKADKKNPVAQSAWKEVPIQADGVMPLAAAISVDGGARALLLAGEHGMHRIMDGGSTAMLRVKVDFMQSPSAWALKKQEELLDFMPNEEIRRIQLLKRVCKDLRTGVEVSVEDGETPIPMEELLRAWMDLRLADGNAEPWS